MEWISQIFNNREIATTIWLAILTAIFIPHLSAKADLKGSLIGVLTALFQPKLFVLFSAYAFWVSIGAFLLSVSGLWTVFELKSTILWFLFSGAVLLGRAIQHDGDASFFANILRDQFRFLAIFEFIAVAYSFALWIELLFVPFITFLTIAKIFYERDEKFAAAKGFIDWILTGIVVIVIWHFIATTIETKGSLFSVQTLREVLLPILLSAFSIPIYYLMHCYAHWENAVIRIEFKTFQSDQLKEEAKDTFFRNFFLQPVLLLRAVRQFQTIPAETKSDLIDIVAEIRAYQRLKKSPPLVPTEVGWSPYIAEQFLADLDLKTNDYHKSGFDNGWFAESHYKDISKEFPRETLVYCIQGSEEVADTLQLKSTFQIDPHPKNGLSALQEAASALALKATGHEGLPNQIASAIAQASEAEMSHGSHILAVDTKRFDEANILDVEFTIRIKHQDPIN